MNNRSKRVLAGAGLGLALAWCAPGADAALLVLDSSQRVTSVISPGVNLTTLGTVDWAYWAPTGTLAAGTAVPTNAKSGAAAISDLSPVGGTGLRGSSTSSTVGRYTWTDGTSPASGTDASLAGFIFNSGLGTNAVGKGMSLTITGNPAVETGVVLFLGAFAATADLTLSLNGAPVVTDVGQVFVNNGPKHMQVYTVRFQPDSPSDVLTVQWTASAVTDSTNGHVGLQAVAVAVPEPGMVGLGLVGVAAVAGRRRRRR